MVLVNRNSLFLVLMPLLVAGVYAQAGPDLLLSSPARGSVKSMRFERIFLIRNERNVSPTTQKLAQFLYDRAGKILQSSTFGNGEKRIVFDRSVTPPRISVLYFDSSGNPATQVFRPNANEVSEAGLCSSYTVKAEEDKTAKISREVEVCADGTIRGQTTYEFDEKNRPFREFRQDSKGRSWESKHRYDATGADEFPELSFTVNDLTGPQYAQTVTYADAKFDDRHNWTQVVGSGFESTRPGRLIYQFIEKRSIEYYPN